MYTLLRMLAFLQVLFDIFSLVLKLSFDMEIVLSGSSGKGTSAFVTRTRVCSFLSFIPHRRFNSVYMTKAIIKKKEIS